MRFRHGQGLIAFSGVAPVNTEGQGMLSVLLRYTMTFIPSVLMTTVALAFLRSNEILFAKSMAESARSSGDLLARA